MYKNQCIEELKGDFKLKKYFAAVLVMLAILLSIGTVFAATEEELNQQKKEATEKKQQAEYQVDMTQNTVNGLMTEVEKANDYLSVLDNQNKETQAKIDSLNAQIAEKQEGIAILSAEQEKQQKDLEKRLQTMYMLGNESYLEVVFSSENYAELISNIDKVATIARADQAAIASLKNAQQALVDKKTSLEASMAEMEQLKSEQQALVASQQQVVAQREALLNQNQGILEAYKAEAAKQEQAVKQLDAELAEIARARAEAEAQKRAAEQAAAQSAGQALPAPSASGFIWPVDNREITSYFGYRGYEATGGVGTADHDGLDIGAWTGEPIYASAAGTVTLACEYGGYGNCVIIAHDNGYSTLYGHQSAIAVSEGQRVNQGDVIGYVGSTGWATGPHLHISFIDAAGNYADPLSFIAP